MANEPVAPEQQPMVIGEETLDGLPFFRNLILGLYSEWLNDQGDEGVVDFVSSVNQVFLEPLVNFDKAYVLFCDYCQTNERSNVVGDHWRVFLMTVYTELDSRREQIMAEFLDMVKRIMHDSPGGQNLYLRKLIQTDQHNVTPQYGPKSITIGMDYLVLLAVRIYVGSVRIKSSPKAK